VDTRCHRRLPACPLPPVWAGLHRTLPSFPTRRSSDLGYTCADDVTARGLQRADPHPTRAKGFDTFVPLGPWIETDLDPVAGVGRSEEHTSELQSRENLVCRLLLVKKEQLSTIKTQLEA